MRVADRASKKAIDFTNVKDRSDVNPRRKKEGDYRGKIIKVTDEVSKQNNDMWRFVVQLVDDTSSTYPYHCNLDGDSVWKIRNLAIAAGKTVPKKKLNVDPNKFVGTEIGIHLVDHEYQERVSSQIDAVFPTSDLPSSTKKKRRAEVDDEVEEDVDEDEEVEDDEEIDVDDL